MVKIPELTKDGQNWKIYHVKFLEVAATFDCLEVLAGRPYEGDDWDGCNTLLCCMFMETVAPSIYFKIHHRTAHENFKYLAKRFRDNDPIPCANELQCAGTATVAEMPENYPMSVNAATEQHVDAKLDEDDLSTTKALTRGTQDVNNGNVGRTQDPHTSLEALAKGTSAKCIETTAVVLESTPHEMQNQSQYSLPLTPRPPIEGEPSGCKQEVVDSVMTAECTNGTVKLAKPNESDVDVDGKATLGSEPATVACGVNEGAETECNGESQLQQTYFYCEEDRQRNGNATENIPIAYGLPLKGEWTVYPSSKASDSRSNAKAFNAAIEHADSLGKSTETANTKEVESEGCSGGMDK